MILVTDDGLKNTPPSIAHLQHGDRPQGLVVRGLFMDRGVALCGYRLRVQNFIWSPLPIPEPDLLKRWTVCLECVLAAIS
jgi:hypothetical protein